MSPRSAKRDHAGGTTSAVVQLDRALQPRGDVRVVGRDRRVRSRAPPGARRAGRGRVRPVSVSRCPVGSSHSSSSGSCASARAIATRCCSPPDSSDGRWSSRAARPTSARTSPGSRRRCRRDRAAKATFSNALKYGSRFALWKTYARPRARIAPRAAASRVASGCPSTRRHRRSARRDLRAHAATSSCPSRSVRASATRSPGSQREVDAVERAHARRLAFAVDDTESARVAARASDRHPVAHLDDTVGPFGDTLGVRDDDDGAAAIAQPASASSTIRSFASSSSAVGSSARTSGARRAAARRDRNALLLATRKRARPPPAVLCETERLERTSRRITARRAREPERELDVLAAESHGQRFPLWKTSARSRAR